MDFGLEDKVVIVTGAGSGIGAATARALAAERARILLADRDKQAVEVVADEIRSRAAVDAVAVTVDVTSGRAVAGMVQAALHRWGRLDRAVNNAGVAQPAMPMTRSARNGSTGCWRSTPKASGCA